MKNSTLFLALFFLLSTTCSTALYSMESTLGCVLSMETICSNTQLLRVFLTLSKEALFVEPSTSEHLTTLIFSWAARHNLLEVFKLAKEQGIDLATIKSNAGLSPLHFAAQEGKDQTVQFLLDAGTPVDVEDNTKTTPFQYAAIDGHLSTANLLLERGANIDHISLFGTALTSAASLNKLPVVQFLLERNANVHLKVRVAALAGKALTALNVAPAESEIEKLLITYGSAPKVGVCAYCKKDKCVKYCTKCRTIYYCSEKCQKDHSNNHKKLCDLIAQSLRL